MKRRTSDLEGADLDAAIAMAIGATMVKLDRPHRDDGGVRVTHVALLDGSRLHLGGVEHYAPSSDWSQAGELIEQHLIAVSPAKWTGPDPWMAALAPFDNDDPDKWSTGSNPLIAAMRALVRAKLGDEVELP